MVNDEYTDDDLNKKLLDSKYRFKHKVGHSQMPICARLSGAKYRDANWMP